MRKETISFVVLVRQSAWNMAAPPQRICVKLCVGIFTEISGENSSVIKIGKITEILCEYWMFMCVRNGWPWFVFITEILFTINCHRQSAVTTNQLSPPISCHHQSAVTTNQLSPPISCHHQSAVTTNQLSPQISCHHKSAVTTNQLSPKISCHYQSDVTTNQLSPLIITIAGLDEAGQWLGLPGHRTSDQCTSSYGATLKPWFTRHQLIL